ncbi:MAG: serine/threonine-protein kinase, partial [Oscillatoria sp. PMC 1068.18]|nr:serine/threonine-protein kinase [Oscillatoria sp. PMC 1068.18]
MGYCFCLNPACPNFRNPDNNNHCHSCGKLLNQPVIFRSHYRVVKLLGQGAFGRTYQVEDTDYYNNPYVIKKFIAEVQGAQLDIAKKLFEQEAQRLYELKHPQIPKLRAYFKQGNSLYLVQEFVEGEDLYKEFLKYGRFNEKKIRSLLTELLPVIEYIHDHNVLHRDIKPQNIMRDEQTKSLILIDFGGAKQKTGTLVSTPGTQIYTPGYAGYEHIIGSPDKPSDLFSLGATCVRLLTGCFPQVDSNGNLQDSVYNPNNGSWRWREILQQNNETISDDLGKVLDKLLEHLADNRYQTAAEVMKALQ